MGILIALVLGLAIGVFLGVGYARRESRGEELSRREASRSELARAWQQGYDAGSLASPAPLTGAVETPVAQRPAASGHASAPAQPTQPVPLQPVPLQPVPLRPVLEPTPEQQAEAEERLAAAKEQRDRRNVNITLYTACLLLVAAASLFIGAALPVSARVAGLAVVVGLFYAGGLVVHGTSRTLRPAATAFTGTGLALLPVAGIALDLLVVNHPAVSWLLTSAVGTVLMVLAAVRLDSRVVAYLTVPFLLSTVMASGAAVQQGMVWALIASIGLAVLMAWWSVEEGGRNRWLPPAYREATARTHQWIVPGAVLAGLVLGVWIEPVQMLLLLLAASAYYATVAVIGPRRFRLASAYAVRGGLLLALLCWASMLEWSTSLTLTALVVYLCAQIPLVHRGRGTGGYLGGYLPQGPAALADLGSSWALAVVAALAAQVWAGLPGPTVLELVPGIGWPAVIVAVTSAVYSLVFLRAAPWRHTRSEQGLLALVWQAVTPLSMVPLLVHSAAAGGSDRAWNLEIILGVTVLMQVLILGRLRRAGHRRRIDTRIAPHVAAAAAVALAYLLTDRLVGRWAGESAVTSAALAVAVLAALAWATATALRHGPLTAATGIRLPVLIWSGASLLALVLLLGVQVPGPGGAGRWGWYTLAAVTGAVSLWWLGRGTGVGSSARVDAARLIIAGVGALAPVATAVRYAAAGPIATGPIATGTLAPPGLGPWHLVLALGLVTGWWVTAAVVTRGRLQRPLRVAMLLAGQGSAAVLVSTVTDRLGGDGSAARAAAAVTLIAGLALRRRLAGREAGVAGQAGLAAGRDGLGASWLVTGAAGLLWLIELGTGADRAALMVMAVALIAAGGVLGTGRGGHWAVLAGAPALVVAASEWFGLSGGWLSAPLLPTPAAVALLVLLALAVTSREIAAAVRGRDPEGGAAGVSTPPPWWADLSVFRPAAVLALNVAALVLALTGDGDGTPHAGALAVAVAAGGLTGYVFARTRGLDLLVLTTVVGVPTAVWLMTMQWQDRGLWFPDGEGRALGSGLAGLAILGWWAALDARTGARTDDPRSGTRAVILWQGGLAVLLLTAVTTVLDVGFRAGLPGDAVVWVSLAAAVAALWLTVAAWGRHLLWPGPGTRADWVLNGRDVAVLLTWAAASRAWWQTAAVEDSGRAGWWHVQVLVLVLVALGFWHARRPDSGGGPRRSRWCFLGAATVFTLAAVYVLLDGTAGMQLTVLIGFALLVVLGLTRREQALTWWGAAGVALSVLWYLRGYTYVYLALLGLVLIVLAVRQLRRHQSGRAPAGDR